MKKEPNSKIKDLINKHLQNKNCVRQVPPSPQKPRNAFCFNNLQGLTEQNGTEAGQNFGSFSLDGTLLPKEKKMFLSDSKIPRLSYLPARLTKGKIWYISFYAYDPAIDGLHRVRIRFNRIKNKNDRRTAAMNMIREINALLHQGWSPFIKSETTKAFHKLFDVLDKFLKMKAKNMEPTSLRSYVSMIGILKEWMIGNGYDESTYASAYNRTLATAFLQDVDLNPKISARTYNNYITFYKSLGNWLVEYGYIPANPFDGIKKKEKKLTKKRRRPLTPDEKQQLFTFLVEHRKYDYLAMCFFCYYCFMRDKEIVSLKVGDLDLKNQLVKVSEDIAKNDHTSWRTIPDVMLPWLLKLDLTAPSDWYLFGDAGTYVFAPSKKKVCERKVAKFWSDHIRPALGWGLDLQFYSLKDTGITDMASAGVPLNLVREQADHSSLSMTDIYMGRSQGVAHEHIKKIGTFLIKEEE